MAVDRIAVIALRSSATGPYRSTQCWLTAADVCVCLARVPTRGDVLRVCIPGLCGPTHDRVIEAQLVRLSAYESAEYQQTQAVTPLVAHRYTTGNLVARRLTCGVEGIRWSLHDHCMRVCCVAYFSSLACHCDGGVVSFLEAHGPCMSW